MELFFEHLKENIREVSESKRLFHGRGKYFLELDYFNIDYFSPYLILIFYKEPSAVFLEELKTKLLGFFELSNKKLSGILYQQRFLEKAPTTIIHGEVPEEYIATVEGNRYHLKFGHAQNLGFFLDMEMGRKFLIENARGKSILNLFSYTCALSVVAMKSEARLVVNFDMSKAAIKRGIQNHQLNNIDLTKVKFFDHDIFKSFARVKREGPYDIVIIDPPSDHGEHFKIERDYQKIIRRLPEWLNENALVITCLNSPHLNLEFLSKMVNENCSKLKMEQVLGLPDYYRETNPDCGLKIIIWRYHE